MVKRPFSFLLVTALACGAAACSKSTPAQDEAKAKKAFQDSQRLKLIKVYEDLAKKYPESPNAGQARERAAVLRQQAGVQTPAPAKK